MFSFLKNVTQAYMKMFYKEKAIFAFIFSSVRIC